MWTYLHEAAWSGDVAEVRLLVAAGVNLEKLENGMSPLHLAAGNGQVETVKVLVELGADKNAHTAGGMTPLHMAAVEGHVETVKVLAQLGAELGVQTVNGETALQGSVHFGHHHVAQVLRELELTSLARKAEAAERMAAEIIEEEEREQAALSKVRVAPPSPHIGLHSVQLGW
jgi:ankyrin repeat protein